MNKHKPAQYHFLMSEIIIMKNTNKALWNTFFFQYNTFLWNIWARAKAKKYLGFLQLLPLQSIARMTKQNFHFSTQGISSIFCLQSLL